MRKRLAMLLEEGRCQHLFVLTTLLALTLVGFWFRYTYVRSSSPYIDEYTTMWVALRTLRFGYPVFSTGALYTQGLLFTYLDALFFKLFGFSEFMARMPSLIMGVAAIPLLYCLGKRIACARVGLITASLLAFDPQAIGWGGRSRNYSLLLFFVMLAVLLAHRVMIVQDRPLYRRLQLVFLLAAVYTHNEAILLFPVLVVLGFLWRGWRWYLRPAVLVEHIVTVFGMVLSFYLYRLQQPEGWGSLGEGRPAFDPSVNIAYAIERYGPFFVGPDQLPFVQVITLLMLAGLVYLLAQAWRGRGRGLFDPRNDDTGLLFLCVTFSLLMAEMVFVVGERRWGTRYLFMLTPLFFLIASTMLVKFADLLISLPAKRGWTLPSLFALHGQQFWRKVTTCLVILLIAWFALPSSLAAANRQELGYDLAFQYLKEQRREGDKVMSFNISACMLYLDEQCDYVAVQEEFHAYATQRGEEWVGAWGGVPVLFTDESLESAIEEGDRMWFVIDQMRFRTRYSARFIQYVWDHMKLMARIDGVFVFLSENPPPAPPLVQKSVYFNLGGEMALREYGLNGEVFKPGDQISLLLRWEGLTHILNSYSVSVHLVDASNFMWAQNDGAALGGLYPTTYWVAGEIISDIREISLPMDIPPGRYRLELGMYQPGNLERLGITDKAGNYLGETIILDYIQVSEEPTEAFSPQHIIDASLGNEISMWGYDVEPTTVSPGEVLRVVLYWTASAPVDKNYTVFVHLTDDEGRIWGQEDSQPENGFYPTSYWDLGEVVEDVYELMVHPYAPPGLYEIEVGMYLLGTGERLPYIDEEGQVVGDAMVLQEIQVRG